MSIMVEFEAEVTVNTTVDMVKHFKGMTETGQQYYWALDISETGFEDEYERPIAWITDALSEETGASAAMLPGSEAGFDDGEIKGWWEVQVKRPPTRPDEKHVSGHWTQEDFDALITAVPWLRPEDYQIEGVDHSREPGPDDVPMFEMET